MGTSSMVSFEHTGIEDERKSAWFLKVEGHWLWFPRTVCRVDGNKILMPEWLAKKKGLIGAIEPQGVCYLGEDVKNTTKTNACKGLFFRCCINNYLDGRGDIVKKVTMRLLRRLSCHNDHSGACGHCLFEDINEVREEAFILPSTPENGEIYRVIFVEDGKDWETGITEDWHYEFLKINNPSEGEKSCEKV